MFPTKNTQMPKQTPRVFGVARLRIRRSSAGVVGNPVAGSVLQAPARRPDDVPRRLGRRARAGRSDVHACSTGSAEEVASWRGAFNGDVLIWFWIGFARCMCFCVCGFW